MKTIKKITGLPLLLLLLLSSSQVNVAESFNPNIQAIGKTLLNRAIGRRIQPIIFEGVHLPMDMKLSERITGFLNLNFRTNIDVATYIAGGVLFDGFGPKGVILNEIQDKEPKHTSTDPTVPLPPRSKAWRKLYTTTINQCIKEHANDADPMEGYLYFGNQDFCTTLSMLCRINPFWANALTVSKDNQYLELNAYTGPGADSRYESMYSSLMKHMDNPTNKINVRFNMKDMTINRITNYASGTAEIVPKEEWNHYASAVCYNVFGYVSLIHANIHILHYIMTSAIRYSTKHDSELSAWADPYDDNIVIKYVEVAAILFHAEINGKPFGSGSDDKILTGANGFNFAPVESKAILKDILSSWGNDCKSEEDFIKNFLLKDLYATAKDPEKVIETAGLLEEYRKHAKNIAPFATKLTEAMQEDNAKAFQTAETTLKGFMKKCGRGVSSIDSISSWVQLMCCTGIMHGSTLSYTRMAGIPEIMRWRNMNTDVFDKADGGMIGGILGTMEGMEVNRNSFSSTIQKKGVSERVQEVLDEYDTAAKKLKSEYEQAIEKRDDLREFGWILTDHCNDGYDGKQHTITTYI